MKRKEYAINNGLDWDNKISVFFLLFKLIVPPVSCQVAHYLVYLNPQFGSEKNEKQKYCVHSNCLFVFQCIFCKTVSDD